MNFSEFQYLSLNEKTRLVLKSGVLLDSIDEYYGYRHDLYSLADVFIEVRLYPVTLIIKNVDLADDIRIQKFLNRILLPHQL